MQRRTGTGTTPACSQISSGSWLTEGAGWPRARLRPSSPSRHAHNVYYVKYWMGKDPNRWTEVVPRERLPHSETGTDIPFHEALCSRTAIGTANFVGLRTVSYRPIWKSILTRLQTPSPELAWKSVGNIRLKPAKKPDNYMIPIPGALRPDARVGRLPHDRSNAYRRSPEKANLPRNCAWPSFTTDRHSLQVLRSERMPVA